MERPDNPRALTPEWLSEIFHQRGMIESNAVEAIEIEPLTDTGVTSQLARLRMAYRANEAGLPESLIAKFSTTNPELRGVMGAVRSYEREVRFYQEIAPNAPLRTPKCYYSFFEPETVDHILLLEDIAPARPGSAIAGCSLPEAERIIHEIARFHAAWWNKPELETKQWLVVPTIQQQFQEGLRRGWPGFLQRAGDLLSDEIRVIGEKLQDRFLDVTRPLYEPPLTIIHSDFQLDNIFFDVGGQADSLAFIDWQFVTKGRGTFDVGYFMASNVQSADRKAGEIELLHLYHRLLVENGVQGYSFENVLEDYRRTLLSAFVQYANVMGFGLYDNKLEAVRQSIIARIVAAVLDLDCGALL